MKKTLVFGTAVLALLLALVFSGCPADEGSSSVAKVSIIIAGLGVPPLPAGSQYYSLSVFAKAQDIKKGTSMAQLGGLKSDGVAAGPSSGNVTIEIPAIPAGDYVLVLGASPDMGGAETQGKMFITGTGTGGSAAAGPVSLKFGTAGTVTVPFTQFAKKDASSGWTVDEIVTQFGTP
jgi:hypothetical protein